MLARNKFKSFYPKQVSQDTSADLTQVLSLNAASDSSSGNCGHHHGCSHSHYIEEDGFKGTMKCFNRSKQFAMDDYEQVKHESLSDDDEEEIDQKVKYSSSILVPSGSNEKLNLKPDEADNCSVQSTDFHTAYESQSTNEHSDDPKSNNDLIALAANKDSGFESVTFSRRGSFDMNSIEDIAIEPEEINKAKEQKKAFKYNPNAMPFFKPATTFVPQDNNSSDKSEENQDSEKKGNGLKQALLDVTLNNEFTPSTPYVHKFRTELCKNWELYGKCKYGDECSFAHGRTSMMVKSDVSALYKTKLCKKFAANGYCPYGMRCQFIHDIQDASPQVIAQLGKTEPKNTQAIQQKPPQAPKGLKTWKPVSTTVTAQPAAAQEQTEETPKIINADAQPFVPDQPVAQQPVATTTKTTGRRAGGFGNKQRSIGLAIDKVIYSEILVHSVKCSVQEYQKKMKMYQNAQAYDQPSIEYVNIYQEQVPRLSLFQDITSSGESSDDSLEY